MKLKKIKPRDEGAANYSEDLQSYRRILIDKVFAHPICAEDCPTGFSTTHECPDIWANETAPYLTLPDYPTDNHDGFCMPRIAKYTSYMLNHVDRFVDESAGDGHGAINDLLKSFLLQNIVNAWPVLAGAVVVSLATSWAYLIFLDCCAYLLVRVSAQLAVAVPFCVGLYFIRCATTGQESGFSTGLLSSAGDLARGICLVGLAAVFLVVVCRAWASLKVAARVVQAGCECVFDQPSVLLEPVISSIARVVVFAVMAYPMFLLCLSGHIQRNPDNSWAVTLDPQQSAYIGFYVFVMLWVLEYINSSSQYILAWVAKSWYFTPYDQNGIKRTAPQCAIFQGMFNLIRYHLGTIALGSLLISLLRPFRIVAKLFVDLAVCNPASACLAAACECCILGCENYFTFLNKNTYIDMAIYSTPFFEAARNAHIMVTGYFSNVFVLNGVQFIFQLGGCGVCTALGFCLSYLVVEWVPIYSDPESPHYINDRSYVVYAATIISLLVGIAYMVVFDVVTDTMFYCYVIDEHYLEKEDDQFNGMDDDWGSLWKYIMAALLGEDDEDEELGKDGLPSRPVYAPDVLREFMTAHGKHAGAVDTSDEDVYHEGAE